MRATNLLPFALVAILTLSLFGTGHAGALGSETPETVPFGPDDDTFYFHLAKDFECGLNGAPLAGVAYESPFHYATNVADDVCNQDTRTNSGAKSMLSPGASFDVRIIPFFDQAIELDEGESITADIWFWMENAGAVEPRFTLRIGPWSRSVGTEATIDTDNIQVDAGGIVWQQVQVDFGPAPAQTNSGTVTLHIDVDVNTVEQRRAGAVRVGLGTTDDHKSTLTVPMVEQIDAPGEPTPPWPPSLSSATVRPGVQHTTSGAQCTTNFVFRDVDSGKLYIGTAAHCIDGAGVGGSSTIRTTTGGFGFVGTIAFSTWETTGVGSDFALIEIPASEEHKVHPAVMHFGGPTQLADMSRVGTLDKVITFGNSGLRPGPEALDWHEGYVTGKSTWFTSVYTITPGIFGDSGSGIMTRDGGAIGAASTIEFAPVPGRNHFGNIPPVIDWLNDNGWNLEIQTWDVLDPGVLPAPSG